ncbi:hypothetical protein [Fimbriiglobus ruber]|uniref:Uncharacterized protein n=1 Tax=Fimbriiglobus ruber TaxID=1908690 RepID=A0A225DKX2_9BACT|nr:hypothetical protein [Fimbriiglobus ruber]OWK41613.1 hypothetical protein FRUB_03691 [Fimbriiglobus ruber]
MGLFDFLRPKPQKSSTGDPGGGDLPEARCHHYTLAHYALRQMAFAEPLTFLGTLASPGAHGFLARMIGNVSEFCTEREPRSDFGAEDLTVHKVRVGRYPGAVIEMPRPRAAAEAFFVAAVLMADLERGRPDPQDLTLRYLTLEKGFVFGGPPRTVLCEWTADGKHLNYGDGPPPELQAFVGAVEALLSKGE